MKTALITLHATRPHYSKQVLDAMDHQCAGLHHIAGIEDMLGVSLSETWETGAYSMFRVKGKVLRDALLTPKPYLAMAFAIQHDSGTKIIHETQFHERGAWVIERMWKQILL